MYKPIGDRLLIAIIDGKVEKPDVENFDPAKGEVLAIGPDVKNKNIKVGSVIVYDARFGGDAVSEKRILIREGSALAFVE